MAIAALLHVWVHLQVIAVGYDLSREEKAHRELQEMNQRLTLELRTRMDLAMIERAARERLKMAPPDPQAIRAGGRQVSSRRARRRSGRAFRPGRWLKLRLYLATGCLGDRSSGCSAIAPTCCRCARPGG